MLASVTIFKMIQVDFQVEYLVSRGWMHIFYSGPSAELNESIIQNGPEPALNLSGNPGSNSQATQSAFNFTSVQHQVRVCLYLRTGVQVGPSSTAVQYFRLLQEAVTLPTYSCIWRPLEHMDGGSYFPKSQTQRVSWESVLNNTSPLKYWKTQRYTINKIGEGIK